MSKIRVLIADDAVVVRRLITDVLTGDPSIEVVAAAPNGRIALSRLQQLQPDLVILDVEMPEMDGLQTLAALRKTHPRLPVIMFSTLTQRGAASTLDALALGANDYVTKPSNVGSVSDAMQRVRDELVPKIKAICTTFSRGSLPAVGTRPRPAAPHPGLGLQRPPTGRVGVVAIGASTGGPSALAALLPVLPADLPVPVLVVQHMPPIFTRLMAERLAARCALRAVEAGAGDRVLPGGIWIAPGDHHMTLDRESAVHQIRIHQGPPENSCRPAVDVLFRSVAETFGPQTLAVVLTGMGQDGLRGCEQIKAAGGQVLVQDEASSVVWGMPGAVAHAGLADAILPPDELVAELLRRVRGGRTSLPLPTGRAEKGLRV